MKNICLWWALGIKILSLILKKQPYTEICVGNAFNKILLGMFDEGVEAVDENDWELQQAQGGQKNP